MSYFLNWYGKKFVTLVFHIYILRILATHEVLNLASLKNLNAAFLTNGP